MRLLWLPDVLRAAGLTVREVDGWRTRGGDAFDPRGLICHATAGSRTSTDAGEIRVLLEGSTSAPPPIAPLYLSRTGTWWIVASGRCNHALTGWGGPLKGLGNSYLIGVEAANDNRGEPWPTVQLDSYQRGVAAICGRMGWTADRHVAAHREHQPGAKTDPAGIDMTKFRQRVTALLGGEDDDMATPAEIINADIIPNPYGDQATNKTITMGTALRNIGRDSNYAVAEARAARSEVALLRAQVAQLAGRDLVDEQAIADAVLAGLGSRDLDDVAQALRAALGDDRAAELAGLLAPTATDRG